MNRILVRFALAVGLGCAANFVSVQAAPPTGLVYLEATLSPIGENAEGVVMSGHSFIAGGADYETIVYDNSSGVWQEQAKLSPWDGNGRIFGYSVSIDTNVAVVSNPWDNGERGAMYIYNRSGTAWQPDTKFTLPASNTQNVWYGTQVDVDGDWIVSGAPRPWYYNRQELGTAYLYHRTLGGPWTLAQVLNSPSAILNDWFGGAVDISGNRMVIGAQYENGVGAAYIYQLVGANWVFQKRLTCPDVLPSGDFGQKLAIDGNTVVVSNSANQKAYVFDYNGSDWINSAVLTPSTDDGGNLHRTLDVDGDLIAIGDPFNDSNQIDDGLVSLYQRTSGGWALLQRIISPLTSDRDRFGLSVNVDNNKVLISAYGGSGTAFVYSVVPEPTTLSSLFIAMICVGTCRRRFNFTFPRATSAYARATRPSRANSSSST